MSIFGNFNTPGKGVLKAPQEKRGFFKFWEVYGRHFWKLLQLNLIYFVFCIPIVTIGPATAAVTKICRNFSQERPCFIFHDFLQAFKSNFKQGLFFGIIDVVFIAGFAVGVPMYKMWAEQNSMIYIPFIICLSCMILFYMMHFYIYLMVCSTNLTIKQIFKNSFYLVSLGLKQSLFTLLASVTVLVTLYYACRVFGYFLFLIPIWPLTFICFITCFNCYPVIRKHVIQPYYDQRGEENPEFAYLGADDEEALFEDKAAEEPKPTKASKAQAKHKGKTIS